jgi:hypothetical protein
MIMLYHPHVVAHPVVGGSRRYFTYVEPHVRSNYFGISPVAGFDTSLGPSRWGYTPMSTAEFAFDTGRLYSTRAFGTKCAIEDPTMGAPHPFGNQTECAIAMMNEVLTYVVPLDPLLKIIAVKVPLEYMIMPSQPTEGLCTVH